MKVTCQCGTVDFDTPSPAPLSLFHCHCTECRRQSSSAFGTSAIFPASDVFPLSDDLRAKLRLWTRPSKEGRTVDCYFCNECGARVIHHIRNADGQGRPTISIKGGLVKGLDWSQAAHIFTESAVVPIPEDAVKWPQSPTVMEGRDEKKD